jgi:hypothetical protein
MAPMLGLDADLMLVYSSSYATSIMGARPRWSGLVVLRER